MNELEIGSKRTLLELTNRELSDVLTGLSNLSKAWKAAGMVSASERASALFDQILSASGSQRLREAA